MDYWRIGIDIGGAFTDLYAASAKNIQHGSPAAKIDPETIEQVAKALPFRTCLIIGEVMNNYPFIIETAHLNVQQLERQDCILRNLKTSTPV